MTKQIQMTVHVLLTSAVLVVLLSACSSLPGARTPTSTPVPASQVSSVVSATGVVVPPQESTLSFSIAGSIVEVLVEEGDLVSEEAVIARLDTTLLDADVAEAEAALEVAQANLERSRIGARPQEIEQAEHDVAAANAQVSQAAAQRDAARAGATEAQIAQAQVDLQAAFLAQKSAQDAHDVATGWAYNADPDYQELFPQDEFVPNPDRVENTAEALDAASQNLAAAQAVLDDMLAGADPDQLRVAEAQVWVAAAEREAAEAYLELLRTGPRPENIAVAEAHVAEAEAALNAAQTARDRAILKAPFSGIVSTLYIRAGEWIGPGQPVAQIAGSGPLQVETTDLNEIDVARVREGAKVTVTFDALPGKTITGTVVSIAPKAEEGAGVNYTVRIVLDQIPEGLRWGMTAFVDISVE